MTDITTVPHAFMQPFVDVGDGKLRSNWNKSSTGVLFGSDPFVIPVDDAAGGSYWLYSTYGPTLPPWPSGARRGSPGTYCHKRHSLENGDDDDPWDFQGIVLRPWGEMPRPPQFKDTEGVETFTACQIGPYLLAMYHGYDDYRKLPSTDNREYIAVAMADDPFNWQKVGPVITEADAMAADPRLSQVMNITEASLQWDPVFKRIIGTFSVQGYHDSPTPPSVTNPLGGSAGDAWRTHLIASVDALNWTISEPIIVPPGSFQQARTGKAVSAASHSACVLDSREPRCLHVFTTWGGNFREGSGTPWEPLGLRHWVALIDEAPLVFYPNPYGVPNPTDGSPTNCVKPRNPDPVQEDSGHVGGPAPLLEQVTSDDSDAVEWKWSMIYHADNAWRKDNGTPAEKAAIDQLETKGRRHSRLARSPG